MQTDRFITYFHRSRLQIAPKSVAVVSRGCAHRRRSGQTDFLIFDPALNTVGAEKGPTLLAVGHSGRKRRLAMC